MTVYHQDFYKKVFDDFGAFLKGPKAFLKAQLDNFNVQEIDQKWVAFVFIMHAYYVLLPTFILTANLLVPLMLFFSIGVFYYLCQVCLVHYQENTAQAQYDQKKLYVFAYAFSLAELAGLILNLVVLFFNLTQILSIISFLLSGLLFIPVMILVILLKLSVFKVVDGNSFSLITFIKLLLEALVETVRNKFGLQAWRELWADFKNEKI